MADEQNTDAEANAQSNGSGTDKPVDAAQAAEHALQDAQQAVDQLEQATTGPDAENGAPQSTEQTRNVDLPSFQQVLADVEASGISLLHDVDLNVKIELGRTHMLVEDVLKLAEGSVVELDKLAGDPVDVYVNDRLVARGEVLVLNDNFCVRVSEVVSDVEQEVEEPDEPEEQPAETQEQQKSGKDQEAGRSPA